MKGLFVKDMRLLLQRKKFFLMIVIISTVLGFNTDGQFVIGYLTLICSLFVLSTISYDEYDNCYPFLMTLPAEREDYVKEKYLFGLILGGIAWMIGCIIYMVKEAFTNPSVDFIEEIPVMLMYIPMFLLLMDLTIPLHLKYGSERGRMMTIGLVGGVIAVVLCIGIGLEYLNVRYDRLLSEIDSWTVAANVVVLFGIVMVVTLTSYSISTRIIQKKDY